jgi:hypothetical protein
VLAIPANPAYAKMKIGEFLSICKFESNASTDRCWGYIDGVLDTASPSLVGCPPPALGRSQTSYDKIIKAVSWLKNRSGDNVTLAIQVASSNLFPCRK